MPDPKMLSDLHDAVAEDLLMKVQSGEATAADLQAAIRFLKNNGIEATLDIQTPMLNLAKALPFQDPNAPLKAVNDD